jgi:uncharacterized membrane protein
VEELSHAEALVHVISPWLIHFTEALAVLIVLYGVIRAFLSFAAGLWHSPTDDEVPRTRTRLALGRTLALALEFLLAADILQTLIAPSVQQVISLGIIAIIRTGLNYFLAKEIEQERKEVSEPASSPARVSPADEQRPDHPL